MASLAGKVAIVTGSSRGIGRAIVERLGREGASVVVTYVRRADKAEDVVAAITASGGQAMAVQADMGQRTDIGQLFQATLQRFGRSISWSTMRQSLWPSRWQTFAKMTMISHSQ